MVRTTHISADPFDILRHYALGDLIGYKADEGSPTVWARDEHRGVHLLGEIRIPKSQTRYVLNPKFELRFNTAFEQVVSGCADLGRTGYTWITPDLITGYRALHEMGFAHSFEAWCEGELAGGCFGVQIGGYMSVESMFYRVSHASKAAYGQTLYRLKERGFRIVDSNPVKDAARNYGEEWIPQWRFEEVLRDAMEVHATLADHIPCLRLPAKVRRRLPLARLARKMAIRMGKYMGRA